MAKASKDLKAADMFYAGDTVTFYSSGANVVGVIKKLEDRGIASVEVTTKHGRSGVESTKILRPYLSRCLLVKRQPIVKNFADADRFVDKLLTGTADEFRLPIEDARQLGGLLKDLLAEFRK